MRSASMQPRTFASVEHACVVSDVQFPGKSGLELPGLLSRAGRHLPVIFVTAHDTPETRDVAQRSGAAAYFGKPVDDQALLNAITSAVDGPPST
jgi:FixJ family two-component response regulator